MNCFIKSFRQNIKSFFFFIKFKFSSRAKVTVVNLNEDKGKKNKSEWGSYLETITYNEILFIMGIFRPPISRCNGKKVILQTVRLSKNPL